MDHIIPWLSPVKLRVLVKQIKFSHWDLKFTATSADHRGSPVLVQNNADVIINRWYKESEDLRSKGHRLFSPVNSANL